MTRAATVRSLRSRGRVLSACLGGTLLLGVGGAVAAPGASAAGVDVDRFFQGALTGTPTKEDCTLSGGTKTQCYRITVAGFPTSHGIGPFCPSKITDGADAGGLWFDGNALYDLDGPFIEGLAQTYSDAKWKMYDDEGNVIVTDTAAKFEGAARPDVDPSLQNHCVQGKLEWLTDGKPIPSTVLIPVAPVAAAAPATTRGNLGVTLDGVVIAASAPVDAILGAYTIAAFDDCGAHFNPIEGYHLHGAVGCSELTKATGAETSQFGYAMDGYPVHSPLANTAGLDGCNGHTTAEEGYHYHAQTAVKNLVIKCMVGQTVATATGGPGAALNATKLEVARAGVLRSKRQLSVLAPITSRASRSVAATFQAAGTSTSFSAAVDSSNRRVLIKRSIPAAQARKGTGILTLAYPGDTDTQPQEVRLRAAAVKANLKATRPTISEDGRVQASGTVSSKARGVVRLQLLYEPAGQATTTLEYKATIKNGKYSFDEQLSSETILAIIGRRGVLHSYTLYTGYLPARMRGEMQSFQMAAAP